MKTVITLTKKELDEAILAYVENNGVDTEGKNITIDIASVRKPVAGFTATIALTPEDELEEVESTKATPKVEKVVEEKESTTEAVDFTETDDTAEEQQPEETEEVAPKKTLFK